MLSLMLLVSLNGLSQEIVDFSLSDCERGSYPQFTKNRLISKEYRSDTLFLKLGMVLNCGIEPLPMVRLSTDSLFVTFNDTSSSYTLCDCCFEVNFTLANIPDTHFTVFYGLKHSIYGNQEDEIYYRKLLRHESKYIFPSYAELEEAMACKNPNQVDENGERIGIWIEDAPRSVDGSFNVVKYDLKTNQEPNYLWLARFSAEGILKEFILRTGPNNVTSIEGRMYYDMTGITPIGD